MASMLGAFVVPFMNKAFYKKLLLFMVSLAVGVLGGSGIFHLIPHVRFFCALQCNHFLYDRQQKFDVHVFSYKHKHVF